MNNPNEPTFVCDNYDLHWQMTRWEKVFLCAFLDKIKPQYSIEVGTYLGGSLQAIAERSGQVISIDISDKPKKMLKSRFDNVEFLVGDSKVLLPETIKRLNDENQIVGFILIDGDHSRQGVKNDIQNVLQHYKPVQELFIICHDSFNPNCREGMRDVDYNSCPYAHYIELDFIPGVYHYEAFDTAEARSMWGGLALIHLKPEERVGDVDYRESQKGVFETILKESIHRNT